MSWKELTAKVGHIFELRTEGGILPVRVLRVEVDAAVLESLNTGREVYLLRKHAKKLGAEIPNVKAWRLGK